MPKKRDGGHPRQGCLSAAKSTIPHYSMAPQGGQFSSPVAQLSCLNREAGLAAVAAELHLEVGTLERDVAEAVERGAAALFLAGFGPPLTSAGHTVGKGEEEPRRKTPPGATKARRPSDREKGTRAAIVSTRSAILAAPH
jgi:hypothetical protein